MTHTPSGAKSAAKKAPSRTPPPKLATLVLTDERGAAKPIEVELADDKARALVEALIKLKRHPARRKAAPLGAAKKGKRSPIRIKLGASKTIKRSRKTSELGVNVGVAKDAFALSARAKAILRGREYAEADLKDAGGAYDIEQVKRLLNGVSRQAIDKRVQEGALLTVPGPSNRRRFPALQFKDDGSPVEGLRQVHAALGFSNAWSVLNFLVNPQTGMNGAKPIDLLRRGEVARVVDAAKRVGVQGA